MDILVEYITSWILISQNTTYYDHFFSMGRGEGGGGREGGAKGGGGGSRYLKYVYMPDI